MSGEAMSTAKLVVDGEEYELPVIVSTEGEVGIDVRKLRGQSGIITYDDGYGNTGSCQSEITFVDGEKGILRYRGYPIEEVAEKCSFTEVCFLLINGHLPSKAELEDFDFKLSRHTLLHEDMKKFFEGYAPSAHPMAILSSMVASLSTYYHEGEDAKAIEGNIIRLLAKVGTIAAFSYKKSIGQPFVYPRNDLSHDVCNSRGVLRRARGPRRRAAATPDPARRSRAELLDLDGADGWLE
jgi:citrate synthase